MNEAIELHALAETIGRLEADIITIRKRNDATEAAIQVTADRLNALEGPDASSTPNGDARYAQGLKDGRECARSTIEADERQRCLDIIASFKSRVSPDGQAVLADVYGAIINRRYVVRAVDGWKLAGDGR